ncbi:methyl-accepting chemotaxis sensory transducer [Desulfitobacterium sp. LBE]|uniref:methyl-accepting chemotaxis protein n=1 Tax=Desulfitobacterium sp. LBE TaxID=884086 RepID=UPI001199FA11|nr:methyl-accepting chemotaxis protein [Desulfitobacterium sp. LBE]TWH57039.1 methyl-accepting chemotaxis sensory transducer [Desulfitobacterium sp. LBE]
MQMLRNLTTAKKIISIILLMSLFILSVGGVGYSYTHVVSSEITDMYSNNLLPVKWLNQVRADNRLVEELSMKIMLTDQDQATEDEELKTINETIAEIQTLISQYKGTTLDSFESEKLASITKNLDAYGTVHEKVLNLAASGEKTTAYAQFTENAAPLMMDINSALNELADYKSQKADQEMNNALAGRDMAKKMILTITLIAIVVSLTVGLMAAKTISQPLAAAVKQIGQVAEGNLDIEQVKVDAADEAGQLGTAINTMLVKMRELVTHAADSANIVSSSAEELSASSEQSAYANNQIADAIKDVAWGAEKQVAQINETSRVFEQISAHIQQIAVNTNQVVTLSDKTDESASYGGTAISSAVSQMRNIEKTVETSAEMVAKLGEKSDEIDQIVTAISQIAAQTNLLALNAAIEAARAGESGRGFAVVADEVRKLAEQSQKASKQIAEMIREVQEGTKKAMAAMKAGSHEVKIGTEVVNNAGVAFADIVTLINQVSGKMREIALAIQHVADGSQQIAASVHEISEISVDTAEHVHTVSAATQEQTASVEQIAASSQNLSSMAAELLASIHKFKV